MTQQEAIQFILPAIQAGSFTWADLGAGSGVFTQVLAKLLGPQGQVLAVDRSSEVFQINTAPENATILPQQADFTQDLDLPPLDGLLMANALHFVQEQEVLLQKLVAQLKPGASFLLIEYDNTLPNTWVPYPVSFQQFRQLAKKVGLSQPEETHRQASRYGQGMIYGAVSCSKSK